MNELTLVPTCGCARCRGLGAARAHVDSILDETQVSALVPSQAALPNEDLMMAEFESLTGELRRCLDDFDSPQAPFLTQTVCLKEQP